MNRRMVGLLLAGSLLVSSQIINFTMPSFALDMTNAVDIEQLTDVSKTHWAYAAIERIVKDLGIMQPKTPDKFMGNDLATRYEVAEALYNAAKTLEVISGLELKVKNNRKMLVLTDVEPQHQELVERIVNEYGLMQAIPGNKFMGNRKISRYELAFELNNYLVLLEKSVSATNRPVVTRAENMTDVKIGHWATPAIKNIVNKYQLMRGYPDNQFKGGNTLTRYELVSVLRKFVDYIDQYLIPIPKYIPTPFPTATPTPVPTPTPEPTVIPTPVPTIVPSNPKTPITMFDVRLGLGLKSAYTAGTAIEDVDIISGPMGQANVWFNKFNDIRLGIGVNGYLLSYGKLIAQSHNLPSLRRTNFGADLDWRILGADYAEDTSLVVGVGYETLNWSGATYSYSNSGPRFKTTLEIPFATYLSFIVDEQFTYFISHNDGFSNDLQWKNEAFIGFSVPAINTFSFVAGYTDSRHSLNTTSDVFGDIGGIAYLRMRF